jgi:hypothetical protein
MNYLIDKNEEPYIDTDPDIFYEDTINPVEKTGIPYLITINSIFRNNYRNTPSTNFFYDLPVEIKKILSLKVIDIQIPYCYYNINAGLKNNYFLIKNETTNQTSKIIVPDGNYTNSSLIDAINNVLIECPDEFQFVRFYIRDIETEMGETIVGLSDATPYIFNFTLDFESDFIENNSSDTLNDQLYHKLGWLLGFRYNYYSNQSVYISEGFIEAKTRKTAFLYLDDFNKNYFGENLELVNNNNLASDYIVSSINLVNDVTRMNSHNIFSTTREYLGSVDIKRIHVKLLDNYGKIIDLNNSDWNFTIKLELMYNI